MLVLDRAQGPADKKRAKKKGCQVAALLNDGTEGRNRTDMMLPPPDFESGASTSSATPAQFEVYQCSCQDNNVIDLWESIGFHKEGRLS